jgi:hypothetical protein
MSASPASELPELPELNRRPEAFWLAPSTRGNGLPAPRWVAVADVTPERADALLAALGQAGVPARAAQVRPSSLRDVDTRVWVDPDRYARAENVLLAELAHGSSASGHEQRPRGDVTEAMTEPDAETLHGSRLRRLIDGASRRAHAAVNALIHRALFTRLARRD